MSTAVHPHVRCPSCGHTRVVTARQARRVRAGEHNGVCRDCRGHRKPSTDENLRFWLERYGTTPAAGVSARATIVAGGAPHELVILATTVFPNP